MQTDTLAQPDPQAPKTRLVVFDASDDLNYAFVLAGFTKHGRQPGAWSRQIDPATDEARDLIYELEGVGLHPRLWEPE